MFGLFNRRKPDPSAAARELGRLIRENIVEWAQ